MQADNPHVSHFPRSALDGGAPRSNPNYTPSCVFPSRNFRHSRYRPDPFPSSPASHNGEQQSGKCRSTRKPRLGCRSRSVVFPSRALTLSTKQQLAVVVHLHHLWDKAAEPTVPVPSWGGFIKPWNPCPPTAGILISWAIGGCKNKGGGGPVPGTTLHSRKERKTKRSSILWLPKPAPCIFW